MSDFAVRVENVTKTFRVYTDRNQSLKSAIIARGRNKFEEFVAVDDVSLEIPRGITFGLLGHNGSGKSTLLKCIARILTPNSGKITVDGRLAAMLEVGSGFHPNLTGRENVYLNGAILGMSKKEIDRKFDAIIDFSGVERFIDQPVKNYSSGMYVRLGFAVAIHVEPDILLVDEVLAVGDMQFQEKCTEKFSELKADGRTVVVVSHAHDLMRTFCDEVAWLQNGRVIETGDAMGIVDAYANKEHRARKVESGGVRFGSGESYVTKLEWIVDGVDTRTCHTGDEVTIRAHYQSEIEIERPIFGTSLDSREGVFVWGHHSRDAGYVVSSIKPGTGSIDVRIPSLPLRPGTFDVSFSIQDRTGTHVYDALQRAIRIDVLTGTPIESGGIMTFGSSFENIQPPRPIAAG
ncbi:MAG: ABC transporter ATP-binding protein [Candidatus Lumbricidophila eiseniae]|uniref:ABC transporter ATP-binding protein n=1 Tax=Candidatus Lumbricidiphila eiseniae TaxID=1969409 RepID=A0A2A6FSV9_9MICO|nr:MAG: ABC transporter ATP-binding protein [Candidatus Lumbricidophila eiseniae]